MTTTPLRKVILTTALLLNCGAASAQQDLFSANAMMPGCRNFIKDNPAQVGFKLTFETGECLGAARGLAFADAGICRPPGATNAQMIRVIVHYIDSRPARMHEVFMQLATEALREAWPCK